MLNHCLKSVLTNFEHDKQSFNTLIPPSHDSAAVTVGRISRLSGPVRFSVVIPLQRSALQAMWPRCKY